MKVCFAEYPLAYRRVFAVLEKSGSKPQLPGFTKEAFPARQTHIQLYAPHTKLRHPIATEKSHGILTVHPSRSAFAIRLGPTNPSSIDVAKETLVFRRPGISPGLRLLVPTFLLLIAPSRLAARTSSRMRILSYRWVKINLHPSSSFGTMLKPRLSTAQYLSMSELLRFHYRVAASKPTSSLFVKYHFLKLH